MFNKGFNMKKICKIVTTSVLAFLIMTIMFVTFIMPINSKTAFAEVLPYSVSGGYVNGVYQRSEEEQEDYNGLIEQIKKANDAAIKKQEEKIKEIKKGKEVADTLNSTISFISDIVENNGKANYIGDLVSLGESAAKLIALCAGGPAAEMLTGSVISVLNTVLTLGDGASQTEIQKLESRLNDQFNAVNDNIGEVKRGINELSENLDESTQKIIDALKVAFDANTAREQLINFTSSRDGNFDFNLFKQYIYGDSDANGENYSRYAYYGNLLDRLSDNKSSDDEIKEAYDNLFKSLDVQVLRNQKTATEIYYDYLMNDGVATESIQHYYYDYLNYTGDKDAEYNSLNFMLDLYETALFADLCLTKCNTYQKLYVMKHNGEQLNDYSKYYYGKEGSDDYIYYKDIVAKESEIAQREEKLQTQMVLDFGYILHIDKSYVIEDVNGTVRTVSNNSEKTFGQVQDGSTIYLNKFMEDFADNFDIDMASFKYQWRFNDLLLAENDGIYQADRNTYTTFKAKVLYKDTEFYSIDFEVGNQKEFSGGNGEAYDPFIISTAEQLIMVKDAPEKCYKLINDIDLGGATWSPLSNKDYKFVGCFDGSGYTISNFTITAEEYGGLFGYIGASGVVANLTLGDCTIDVENNSVQQVYTGAFAGICDGELYNCHLIGKVSVSGKISGTEKTSNLNKAIYANVGGFVGKLSGGIYKCSVETKNNSRIYAETHRFYDANSDGSNKSYAYVGGIVGIVIGGTIRNCYVTDSVDIDAYGYSTCNKALSTRYPYITVLGGGITAKADNAAISNVYSINDLEYKNDNKSQKYYIENNHWNGGSLSNNCSVVFGNYISGYNANQVADIKTDILTNVGLRVENTSVNVDYEFNTLRDRQYGYCYEGQLYECGEKSLKTDDLIILINNVRVEDYTIIEYYDFNTSNSNHSKYVTKEVSIIFSCIYNDETIVAKLILPITVKENKPIGLVVVVPDYAEKITYQNSSCTVYEQEDEVLSKGESVRLYYIDGSYDFVTESAISSVTKFNKVGLVETTISSNGFEATYSIFVRCNRTSDSYELLKIEEPTCEYFGYSLFQCPDCGDTYISDTVPRQAHSFVVLNAKDSTCTQNGYTGDVVCSVCEYMESSGEIIPILDHHYYAVETDKEWIYADERYHFCRDCEKEDEHIVVTTENTDGTIIYTCTICGYIKTAQVDLTTIPRVVVSNASVLKGGKVVVYVQLLNNPGIAGASCSIIYDKELKFVSCEQGNLLPNAAQFTVTPVRSGLVNVTFVQTYDDKTPYGNLLKLTFIAPETAEQGTEYSVSIGYTQSKEQFIKQNRTKLDILTIEGVVTIVDRLPGDVNNDGVVDILDAILIALACNNSENVNDQLLIDANYSEYYADVNLSGDVSIADILPMLQYLVGGYDAQLYAGSFKLTLNPNDGKSEADIITINCKDENGKQLSWSSIEELLQVMQRDGYHFDGWYTYDGMLISLDKEIVYNTQEYDATHAQTLYAHWTMNKLIFNGNGATNDITMDEITFNKLNADEYVLVNDFEREYTVIFNDGQGHTKDELTKVIKYTFEGWATDPQATEPDYRIGDIISLKSSKTSLGECTLYAIWSVEPITLPNPNIKGIVFQGWYLGNVKVGIIGDAYIPIDSVELTAKYNATTYSIVFNGNGGSGSMSDIQEIVYSDINSLSLPMNKYERDGYIFNGWATNPKATIVEYKDGECVINNLTELNSVTLYAIWKAKEYKITLNVQNNSTNTTIYGKFENGVFYDAGYSRIITKIDIPNKEGYIFYGYFDSIKDNGTLNAQGRGQRIGNDGTLYFSSTSFSNNVTLYALWKPIKSVVIFETNGGTVPNKQIQVVYDVYTALPTPSYNDAHKFEGWYTDKQLSKPYNGLLQYTKNDITLYAKWSEIIISVCNSTIRTGSVKINGSGHYTEDSFSLSESVETLKQKGYNSIEITINCDISKQDNCYQYYYVTNNGKQVYSNQTYHTSGWHTYTFTFTLNLNDITSNTFKFKCQAENKIFKDFWIGTVVVNIKAKP